MSTDNFSGKPAVRRLFQFIDGIAETVLGNTSHSHMIPLLCLKHGVTLRQTGRHRFFHYHIHPCIHRMNGNLCVNIRRGADMNNINVRHSLNHLLMVVKHLTIQMILLLHPLRLFRVNVTERHNFYSVRKLQKTIYMLRRNITSTNDCCF